jgi:hypothetical protein
MAAYFFLELRLAELFLRDRCRMIQSKIYPKRKHGILYTTGRIAKCSEGD